MFAQHFCDPVRRSVLRASLALVLSAVASVSAFSQIRADPRVVAAAPPELLARVKATPFNYFRFVNKPWIEAVCRGLAEDVRRVPNVELHGDAHVEQFALTDNAYGLDDFDDSCRGPAFVDIIRFLGSVDLVSRQRGWTNRRDALFDRFFSAYRRGIAQPGYQPPEPAVVAVFRKRPTPSHEEFMAMGERLMEPMSPHDLKVAAAGLRAFTDLLRSQRPDLPPDFLTLIRAGWLHSGIGSADRRKVLLRVRGRSPDASSDQLLEAKNLGDLGGISCLDVSVVPPTLRIVEGTRNLGRLKHDVVLAGPEISGEESSSRPAGVRNWWIRSWDPTYREVSLSDLRSWDDLAEIVADAGAQLAEGSLRDAADQSAVRQQTLSMLNRLEPRLRSETIRLVDQLITAWKELQ